MEIICDRDVETYDTNRMRIDAFVRAQIKKEELKNGL
jgi:hypothetical protein